MLAAFGAAFDGHRTVSGGFLGRVVAGAAVHCARHWARTVRAGAAGSVVSAGAVPLANPRGGLGPARPRVRHPSPPGDRPPPPAGDAGSGPAGAVAGPTRADNGLGQ